VSPAEPVHVFAHSMGGLDARYMISRLGMAPRVLSLTTLGTPHRGCPFADWALSRLGRLVCPILDYLSLPYQAFHDLTVARSAEFNDQTPDAPGVRYFSVAGRYEPRGPHPLWRVTAPVVRRAEGPNDGVVSIASASYGESTSVWDGDHLSLVNWPPTPFRPHAPDTDRVPHYAGLVRALADEGF